MDEQLAPQSPQPSQQVAESASRNWTKIALLSLGGVLLAGGLVFAGYSMGNKPTKAEPKIAIEITPIPTPTPDPTANLTTYRSKIGDFNLKYPNDWFTQGFDGGKENFNEYSNPVRFCSRKPSKDAISGDYMCVIFDISTRDKYLLKDGAAIATLDNNLKLYQIKSTHSGKEYVELFLTRDGYSTVALSKGTIVKASASFNYAQGDVSSLKLSYEQQIASSQYKQAIEILKSINFDNKTTDWNTYTDAKLGFSIQYPTTWKIEKPSNTMGTLDGESVTIVSDTKFAEGLEGGPYSIGISNYSNPNKKSFKTLIAEHDQMTTEFINKLMYSESELNEIHIYKTTMMPAQFGVDDVFFQRNDKSLLRVAFNPYVLDKPFIKQSETHDVFVKILSTFKFNQ